MSGAAGGRWWTRNGLRRGAFRTPGRELSRPLRRTRASGWLHTARTALRCGFARTRRSRWTPRTTGIPLRPGFARPSHRPRSTRTALPTGFDRTTGSAGSPARIPLWHGTTGTAWRNRTARSLLGSWTALTRWISVAARSPGLPVVTRIRWLPALLPRLRRITGWAAGAGMRWRTVRTGPTRFIGWVHISWAPPVDLLLPALSPCRDPAATPLTTRHPRPAAPHRAKHAPLRRGYYSVCACIRCRGSHWRQITTPLGAFVAGSGGYLGPQPGSAAGHDFSEWEPRLPYPAFAPPFGSRTLTPQPGWTAVVPISNKDTTPKDQTLKLSHPVSNPHTPYMGCDTTSRGVIAPQ